VESLHKTSESDSSIFKTPTLDSFVKSQYVLIMVNLKDISSPPPESSGYFLDLQLIFKCKSNGYCSYQGSEFGVST
jgi:hypothetical protein